MNRRIATSVGVFAAGALFSVGLGVAGMTQPAKVQNFLDIAGNWDPSLALVMMGAIPVTFLFYRFARRQPAPVQAGDCAAPAAPGEAWADRRLIAGSALFGMGWGLAGFCPGPAITSLVTLSPGVLALVGGMVAGMFAFRLLDAFKQPLRPLANEATDG